MNVAIFLFVAYIVFRVWRATQAASTGTRANERSGRDLSARIERLREWDGETPLAAPPERSIAAPPIAAPRIALPESEDDASTESASGWPSEIVRASEPPAAVSRRAHRSPPEAMRAAVDAPRERRPATPLVFPTQNRPAPVRAATVTGSPVPAPLGSTPPAAVVPYEGGSGRTGDAFAASVPPVADAPGIASPVPPPVAISRATAAAFRAVVPVAAPLPRPAWAEARAEGVTAPVAVPERALAVRGRARAPAEAFEAAPAAASAGKIGSGVARAEMQRSMLGKAPTTAIPGDRAARGGRAKG